MKTTIAVLVALVALAVPLGAQSVGVRPDEAVDKIIAREHFETRSLAEYRPVIETHIQETHQHRGREVPGGQFDLRGRAMIGARLAVAPLGRQPGSGYSAVGFLEEAFIDRDDFDREHYTFQFLGAESARGVPCLVFKVEPSQAAKGSRFRGRIWAEQQNYTIVRFAGTFAPPRHWIWLPFPHPANVTYADFDSYRAASEQGLWLPSDITSKKTNLRDGPYRWNFTAQTRFSGYEAAAKGFKSTPNWAASKVLATQ